MLVTYQDSELAMAKLNAQSQDEFYWDGWDICRFTKMPAAMYEKSGRYNHQVSAWGYITKYPLNGEGNWEIDLDN